MNNKTKWNIGITCFMVIAFALPITLETFNIISLNTAYLIVLMGVVSFPIVCIELDESIKNLWVFRNKNK